MCQAADQHKRGNCSLHSHFSSCWWVAINDLDKADLLNTNALIKQYSAILICLSGYQLSIENIATLSPTVHYFKCVLVFISISIKLIILKDRYSLMYHQLNTMYMLPFVANFVLLKLQVFLALLVLEVLPKVEKATQSLCITRNINH